MSALDHKYRSTLTPRRRTCSSSSVLAAGPMRWHGDTRGQFRVVVAASHVDMGLSQIAHIGEIHTFEPCPIEIGALEGSTGEIGIVKIRARQHGAREIGVNKIGFDEAVARKLTVAEVGAGQIGAIEAHTKKFRLDEARALENGAGEIGSARQTLLQIGA